MLHHRQHQLACPSRRLLQRKLQQAQGGRRQGGICLGTAEQAPQLCQAGAVMLVLLRPMLKLAVAAAVPQCVAPAAPL
jgi:hypothetical protein